MDDQLQSPTDSELDEIREEVNERVAIEAAFLQESAINEPAIDSNFVAQCLQANQLGDGTLYVALQHGRFVYNATLEHWLRWAGHLLIPTLS